MPRQYQPPQSLRFVAEEVPAFIKARTHHKKADDIDVPYQVFLERWQAFEYLYQEVAPLARKHDRAVFARDAGEAEVLTACLSQLSRPRIDAILGNSAIADLNVRFARLDTRILFADNHMLEDMGLDDKMWQIAKKDLRFALKANTQKGLHAVALLLLMVRASCDPKVKKSVSLVKDEAALTPANSLLKDCVVHLVEHFDKQATEFFKPAFRGPMRRV